MKRATSISGTCARLAVGALLLVISSRAALGQTPPAPFTISVAKATAQPAPGLQSFALAQSGGKWLLIGGRTNGFHRTSTVESTFPTRFSNEHIYVVDPLNDQTWEVGLPPQYKQRLRVTNMEFYQDGDTLYFMGGYGSTCDDDKPECYQTYPNVTAIKVSQMIGDITSGKSDVAGNIVSITDERFRVTGGALRKLGGYFFLVCGHDYGSIYKGAVNGTYTDQIARFRISFNGTNLSIGDYSTYTDPNGGSGQNSQLHRRDLNVVEAIRPNGSEGITVYGGVFTSTGGPWRNPIYIDNTGIAPPAIRVDSSFQQKMSIYECGHVTMFDPNSATMYTTLLGGISYYYYNSNGQLEESNLDNPMPFINSITTEARLRDGTTVETPQPPARSLPLLLGANGVFVPAARVPRFHAGDVIDYSKLPSGRSLIGYFYGGIYATAPQSGGFNPTYAEQTIYEVYVAK
jgi:hypothetical protein